MPAISDKELGIAVGAKVRKLRYDKGYRSGEKFAEDYDINRSTYWRIENGHMGLANLETLNKVLKIHDLSPLEFFNL